MTGRGIGADRRAGIRVALVFFVLYLASLFYSPALLREWSIVSRGVRLDQFLLLLSLSWLALTVPGQFVGALVSPVGLGLLAFTAASFISALASAAVVPQASFMAALAVTWGQSRSLLVFVVGSIMAKR